MTFLWTILGLGALVASTAGAIFALHPHNEANATTGGAVASAGGGLVCYGIADVESGVVPLYPLQPGRAAKVLVKENDKVAMGAVLLRLDATLAEQRLREAKADLDAAEAQLGQAEQLPKQHRAKLAQQRAAIDAMKARRKAAELVLQRRLEQVATNSINKLDADAVAQQVEELDAAVQAEGEKFKELRLDDPEKQLARARAERDAKKAKVDQAQYAVNECELKAPVDGVVLQITVSAGSVLGSQTTQPPVQFAPTDIAPIVRADVEQEFADRVHPGQSVSIQEETGGKQTWTGKVQRLSKWYTSKRASQPEAMKLAKDDVHTLECIIALDPNQTPLRLGQRLRVTISKD